MTSTSNSRAVAVPLSRILAAFFVLAVFTAPQHSLARTPQSADPPPTQQQTQDPVKKDPAPASPVAAAAAKANAPKPHRVFTNDDFSSSSSMPIAPGAHRRLKQLNRCDHACFNDVKKQALSFGYLTVFPRSTREEMDDRLANDIEELQNDPKWQRLLLEMISAHIDSCLLRQKAQPPDDSSADTPTRGDLQDEEEGMKDYRPPPGSNFNTASSAVLAYRFSSKPDPLRASLMVHQYMDEIRRDCPVVLPTSNSQDDSDDP
ncbi:MAG TPA: hypothetical protein VJO16_05855 [Candidatus Acidoferrum sp.]|nr:hypothetical protein [Candidatus Acidoferrum sp.]